MTDRENAQEIARYTEIVKQNIGYWELGGWLCEDGRDGYKEADNIVGFIVDEICSPLPYTTLRGQAFPRSVIQSKLLQANIYMVESVLSTRAARAAGLPMRLPVISAMQSDRERGGAFD